MASTVASTSSSWIFIPSPAAADELNGWNIVPVDDVADLNDFDDDHTSTVTTGASSALGAASSSASTAATTTALTRRRNKKNKEE